MLAAAHPDLQTVTLPCIDDNGNLLVSERPLVESFGYPVLTVENGGKGLRMASEYLARRRTLAWLMPETKADPVRVG
jgi:hypothetical protein